MLLGRGEGRCQPSVVLDALIERDARRWSWAFSHLAQPAFETMWRAIPWLLTFAQVSVGAHAQDTVSTEKISIEINSAFQSDARVIGELRIPKSNRDRLPAVLIVNSSPGFDGRSSFYALALNQAGIATLEVDMFQGKGLPATPRHEYEW